MYAARRLFTTTISFLLIGGLVCARICDMRCAYAGCENPHLKTESATKNAAQSPQSGHCHQVEGESNQNNLPLSLPPGDDHSPKCQIHADATAVEILVKAKSQYSINIPMAEVYHGMKVLFDRLSGMTNYNQVFRPPPARGSRTILRI
jgi:hypothetical protein